jgi:hypothetical protein
LGYLVAHRVFSPEADIESRSSTHCEAVTRELKHLARAGLVQQAANLVVRDLGALIKMLRNESGLNCALHAQHLQQTFKNITEYMMDNPFTGIEGLSGRERN